MAQDPEVMAQAQALAAEAYTEEELIFQTDFEIEASSSRRRDIDQQLEALSADANANWPILMQQPNPLYHAQVFKGMALQAKLLGLPKDYVAGLEQLAQLASQTPVAQEIPA
jgi:hypothetical protein